MAGTTENDQALTQKQSDIPFLVQQSTPSEGSLDQDINHFIKSNIESARETWHKLGGVENHYRFGNINLCVRHIGACLVDTVTPAISHAHVDNISSTINGTVYALDATALSMQNPPQEWPFETETYQGQQRIKWDPETGVALNSDESRGVWQLFNLKTCEGLYWVTNEHTLPSWEAASPLRIFLHWLAWQTGDQLIHAAGLQWNNTGILLTGPGGSGKSTTTAAAVMAGWKTIGDDFVLLSDKNRLTASCIYDTIKLTPASLDKISNISGTTIKPINSNDDKARIHVGRNYRQQLLSEIRIDAIFALQLSNRTVTSVIPASKAHIMTALAPTTMFMLKTGMKESFANMTGLVGKLPCFVIELGIYPEEVVEKITALVEQGI